jgi:hypothetical protein
MDAAAQACHVGLIIRLTMLLELNEVWARNPILIVDVHGTPKFASVVRIEPRKGELVAAVWTQIEFEVRTFFKRMVGLPSRENSGLSVGGAISWSILSARHFLSVEV